ncbi:MAG: hypothetical protein ACFB6R_10365 [Alphaproteobacteria bacterium]
MTGLADRENLDAASVVWILSVLTLVSLGFFGSFRPALAVEAVETVSTEIVLDSAGSARIVVQAEGDEIDHGIVLELAHGIGPAENLAVRRSGEDATLAAAIVPALSAGNGGGSGGWSARVLRR